MNRKIKDSLKKGFVTAAFPIVKKQIENSLRNKWRSFGVESSNICNANCSFCGYGKNVDKREKGFIDAGVLKYALELYSKSGGGTFHLTAIIGDPLTDKKFLEKVRFVKRNKSINKIVIFTNLIGLDNFDIKDFVTSGITDISISSSIGDKKMYERLYGIDAYDRVIMNMLALLKTNQELGSPINIGFLFRVDYDFLPKLHTVQEFNEIEKYVGRRKISILDKAKWDDWNGLIKHSDLPKGGEFKPNIKVKNIPCHSLFRKIQVLKNGDISICSCRISPELVVDNIFNYNSLDDYWKGEKLNTFRRRWNNGDVPAVCRGCTHYSPYTQWMKSILLDRLNQYSSLLLHRKIRRR